MTPSRSLSRLWIGCLPALLWAAWLCTPLRAGATDPLPRTIEFNRDIRPILSDRCFNCHGPDKARRKADLRLDTEAGAFADLGGYRALVSGKPAESELYRRISSDAKEERMPPAKAGPRLTPREVALVRRWIEQGARWQKHWSLIPPRRPPLPSVRNPIWPRNPLDHFILARLEYEGLAPAPEADRTTLIRRATLDLTGLPPTPGEVDAFLADLSPDAYEKVVARLLASPRYGERLAVGWLDAARYADTNGYQTDGERTMWRWRDWVIDAYNRNLPFDRFTIEQLAGDLLPQPTLEQRIATGFNRNHRGNAEGGIIPEEYAVEYVVDRVETTATVWLGLTLACTRCHDHKYDPFTQKEFYQLFAFFNNMPERGKAIKFGNSPPYVRSPLRWQEQQLRSLDGQRTAAESAFAQLGPPLKAAQAAWEKVAARGPLLQWFPSRGLAAHFPLDSSSTDPTRPAGPAKFRDGEPAFAPGKLDQAAVLDGKRFLDTGNVGDFGFLDKFSLGAWIKARGPRGGTILARGKDQDAAAGYRLALEDGKVHVNLVVRWLDDSLRVQTVRRLAPDRWYHVLATYDGSRTAAGIRVYIDGQPEKLKINLDDLNQSFKTKEPLLIGGGGGPGKRFEGLIDEVRVYHRCLPPEEAALLAVAEPINTLAALPPEKRTQSQAGKLRAYFLERQGPPAIRQAWEHVVTLREQREKLIESFPTTMVMEELPTPRPTYLLIRGQYDKQGPQVQPGVPANLPPLANTGKLDRLALAKWLVDPAHPLTARVAVNRYWQMYFGTGLVKTAEDFGSQGEWPSHPELLDWLATEFVRTGWDVKAMQRLIVTSAAYRQSSKLTPALHARDPENRLLARGPRFRWSAEILRDQALAASGLLVERLGGPSVKPYQPAGLWRELTEAVYQQDHGAGLYRRSLYTFWKRTIPPPAPAAFDAPARETCTVHRPRTNTPLQALALMNEVTYVEAARVLAQRVLREAGPKPEDRILRAFRLATGRWPGPAELRILRAGLDHYLAHFRQDPRAAEKLIRIGEFRHDERLNPSELAAYTALASLILNLDETVTKE